MSGNQIDFKACLQIYAVFRSIWTCCDKMCIEISLNSTFALLIVQIIKD